MSDPIHYLCVRRGSARKAGLHSTGTLSYAVLRDAQATEAYFIVTGNSSSGYYSREAVALAQIERCLAALPADAPIPAKALRPAFRGKSANDGGFLLALLRHEGLVAPAPDAAHLSVRSGDWAAWREAVLATPGEPFELPTRQVKTPMPDTSSSATAAITAAPPASPKARKSRKDRDPAPTHPDLTADGGDHDCPA